MFPPIPHPMSFLMDPLSMSMPLTFTPFGPIHAGHIWTEWMNAFQAGHRAGLQANLPQASQENQQVRPQSEQNYVPPQTAPQTVQQQGPSPAAQPQTNSAAPPLPSAPPPWIVHRSEPQPVNPAQMYDPVLPVQEVPMPALPWGARGRHPAL